MGTAVHSISLSVLFDIKKICDYFKSVITEQY